MSIRNLGLLLARAGTPRERDLARAQIAREGRELARELGADERALAATMAERGRDRHLVVGRAEDGTPYRVNTATLGGIRLHLTGETGSGKTRIAGNVADHVVVGALADEPVALSVFDFKGGPDGLADVVQRSFLGRVQALPPRALSRAFDRFLLFQPFGTRITPWQMLARDVAVSPLTQAAVTAEILGQMPGFGATGQLQAELLQATIATAVIEGWSIIELRYALEEPDRLREVMLRSPEPSLRVYAATRLRRDLTTGTTAGGLTARLDVVKLVREVNAVLVGPDALDVRRRCFGRGTVSVFDYSDPPEGAQRAMRALGAMNFVRLSWAIFDGARDRSTSALLITDEVQQCLTPAVSEAVSRVITTGRSFGVGYIAAHQTVTQLPADLRSEMATSMSRMVGQGSREDAQLSVEFLPVTGTVPRPRRPGEQFRWQQELLSDGEELRHRVAQIRNLPRRHFVFSERGTTLAPRVIRAADFEPPRWRDLDPGLVREFFASQGVDRDAAFARARAIEEAAAARILATAAQAERDAASAPRSRRRRAERFQTPDAVGEHDARERAEREVP